MTARDLIDAITTESFKAKNGLDTEICIYTPGNLCDNIKSVNLSDISDDYDGSFEEICINCN